MSGVNKETREYCRLVLEHAFEAVLETGDTYKNAFSVFGQCRNLSAFFEKDESWPPEIEEPEATAADQTAEMVEKIIEKKKKAKKKGKKRGSKKTTA